MKLSILSLALVAAPGVKAFGVPKQQLQQPNLLRQAQEVQTRAQHHATFGAAILIASLLGGPTNVGAAEVQQPAFPSSMIMSDSMSLDFALPSYDSISKNNGNTGFGEGAEAFLNERSGQSKLLTDPGADEKEKQMQSMLKAEEARKAKKLADKEKQKEREAEDKRRAQLKKEERDRRLRGIFD